MDVSCAPTIDPIDLAYAGLGPSAWGDGMDHDESVPQGLVCAGDAIETGDVEGDGTFLRGHGTRTGADGTLRATICGVVERVNKLVTVRPLKSRYAAEVGDVVVGRVDAIAGKRWKVRLRGAQDAALHLSAVNLPGGAQRRRTWEDELNMRQAFAEGDCLCAEVQSIARAGGGGIALHARGTKYGKLSAGTMVEVPAFTVKKQKQNFLVMADLDVGVILGCNGCVWVGEARALPGSRAADANESAGESADADADLTTLLPRVALVANVVRCLGMLGLPVTSDGVQAASALAMSCGHGGDGPAGGSAHDVLGDAFMRKVVDLEATQRMQG